MLNQYIDIYSLLNSKLSFNLRYTVNIANILKVKIRINSHNNNTALNQF